MFHPLPADSHEVLPLAGVLHTAATAQLLLSLRCPVATYLCQAAGQVVGAAPLAGQAAFCVLDIGCALAVPLSAQQLQLGTRSCAWHASSNVRKTLVLVCTAAQHSVPAVLC